MAKFCPECGKSVTADTSKFCDDCGAKLNVNGPKVIISGPQIIIDGSNEKKDLVQLIQEEKNPILAGIFSLIIPGLGQVYNGETAKGVRVLLGTLIGLFLFIIPGVIVWFFGIYDAYTIATEMNKKEIPFKPTKTAHVILFFIFALFMVIFTILLILLLIISPAIFHH